MAVPAEIAIRNKIIGLLIRRTRTESGKTQRECAELLGYSPSTFGKAERGEKALSLPELEALAHLLDVPVAHLWDDDRALDKVEEEPLPLAEIMALRRKMVAIEFRRCREAAGLSQQKMAEFLGCSSYMISRYESGESDIPLAELEYAAGHCGKSLVDLIDEHVLHLSEAQQERAIAARINELPPDVRDFVLNPTNALYLRIAMLLSAMKADSLRQIAETLLDITY